MPRSSSAFCSLPHQRDRVRAPAARARTHKGWYGSLWEPLSPLPVFQNKKRPISVRSEKSLGVSPTPGAFERLVARCFTVRPSTTHARSPARISCSESIARARAPSEHAHDSTRRAGALTGPDFGVLPCTWQYQREATGPTFFQPLASTSCSPNLVEIRWCTLVHWPFCL